MFVHMQPCPYQVLALQDLWTTDKILFLFRNWHHSGFDLLSLWLRPVRLEQLCFAADKQSTWTEEREAEHALSSFLEIIDHHLTTIYPFISIFQLICIHMRFCSWQRAELLSGPKTKWSGSKRWPVQIRGSLGLEICPQTFAVALRVLTLFRHYTVGSQIDAQFKIKAEN